MKVHQLIHLVGILLILIICLRLSSAVQKKVKRSENLFGSRTSIEKTSSFPEVLKKRFARSPQTTTMPSDLEESDPDDEDRESGDSDDLFGGNKNGSSADFYLPEGYNKLERPRFKFPERYTTSSEETVDTENLPVPVWIYMSINSISDIDEVNDQIDLELDMIIEWIDFSLVTKALERADFNVFDEDAPQKTLDPIFLRRLWKPDVFVDNLAEVIRPKFVTYASSLKFGETNGKMTYTSRLTMKIDCDFDFQYYPADTQQCDVLMRSYSYDSKNLTLSWRKPEGVYLLDTSDDNFDLAIGAPRRFGLDTHLSGDKQTNETYDAIQFTVFMRRRLSYQLIQTYIPSILYLGITWLCFMMPTRMIEARMAVAMTTLLTLTAMFGSVRESTPVVSYVKAIDIWMATSILFVFATLLEFAILLWVETANEQEQDAKKDESEQQNGEPPKNIRAEENNSTFGRLKAGTLAQCAKVINLVEGFPLIIIVIIFLVFNIVYWSWLLICSGYFKWAVDQTHNAVDDKGGAMAGEQELMDLPLFANAFP